jgi:hypothetical protein
VNATTISKLVALAALAAVAVALGTAVGGSRAAGLQPTATGPMPMCDPSPCPPPTTTSTTSTTPTTTTSGNPSRQCSDGWDNDGDRTVDASDPGCSGPSDDNESDDPPLESYVGTATTQFGRIDDGAVLLDSYGNTIRCARLGAERSEHGFASKGWSLYMSLRWCWNGKVITSWDSWDKWVKNHIPFPASLIYPLDWSLKSETAPTKGVAQTSAFVQAKVQICPVKLPACFTWFPWLRFTIDAQGHAFCQSDAKASIPDCKG